MGANSLEAFTVETINRKDIQLADYNPRKITESAKKKLRKFLKENGLWQPLIVNKRTMTLVSGHQRLSCMDSLLRKDDYGLTVSLIDVGEKTEVAGNVFMNNTSAMGEWDITALTDLKDIFPDIDFEIDMGFDTSDLDVMFGKQERIEAQYTAIDEAKQYTADTFREAKKRSREKAKAENQEGLSYNLDEGDYCVTIVFNNNHEKHDFMRKAHKPETDTHLKSTILFDIYDHAIKLRELS